MECYAVHMHMKDQFSQKSWKFCFSDLLGLNLQLINTDSYLPSQPEVAYDMQ